MKFINFSWAFIKFADNRKIKGHESTCKRCRNEMRRESNALKAMREKLNKIKYIAKEAGINEAIVRLIIDEYNEQQM